MDVGVFPVRGKRYRSAAAQELLSSLESGAVLRLRREPDNASDPDAVMLMAVRGPVHHRHVGYLPRALAARLAPELDAGWQGRALLETPGRRREPLVRVQLRLKPRLAEVEELGTDRERHGGRLADSVIQARGAYEIFADTIKQMKADGAKQTGPDELDLRVPGGRSCFTDPLKAPQEWAESLWETRRRYRK